MKSFFKAGAARVDITPPLGTLINGDFIIHYAQRIHDSLYAKAIVFETQETTVVFVVVDICAMSKEFIDQVKLQITEKTGIPAANILISATHTHYGGSVADLLMGAADLPYTWKLPSLIVKAVVDAQKRVQPAQIGYGKVNVPEHVVGRRFYMKEGYVARNPVTGKQDTVKTNPFGDEHQIDKRSSVVDPELNFVAIKDNKGNWISILANYSMHYVGDCKNGTITADYFGYFSDHLTATLSPGEEFVAILSNGSSGEASIWDFIQPNRYPKEEYAKSQLIGKDLANKVIAGLDTINWEQQPELAAIYEEVIVGTRKPSAAEVTAAKKIVEETDFENFNPFAGPKPTDEGLRTLYAREQVLLHEFPNEIAFPVQAIKLGSGIIGALGGEFFAETGLWLKKNKPVDNYFTICLANGFIGYVPPAHEIEKGGYETWRCRTSFLEPGAEKRIREKLLEFVKQPG